MRCKWMLRVPKQNTGVVLQGWKHSAEFKKKNVYELGSGIHISYGTRHKKCPGLRGNYMLYISHILELNKI